MLNPWGGSSTATKQQWYPPLEFCTTAPGRPHEAIYNALADLTQRLQSSTIVGEDANGNSLTLGGLAQSEVFNKVGSGKTTAAFFDYLLNRRPQFYNGLSSSYRSLSLEPGGTPCRLLLLTVTQTVSEDFNGNAGMKADTDTPSNPLLAFFNPNQFFGGG